MAWYSLYKWFRTFRKREYVNYVSWYIGYLFNSLSEEEQRKELERQEELKKKREHDGEAALENLLAMY